MARSEVMEADSGFGHNMRSPGSASDLVIKVNGKKLKSDMEEGDDMVGEGLFSFDEDIAPQKGTGKLDGRCTTFDPASDVESEDSGHFDMSNAFSTFSGGGAGVAARTRHIENPLFEEEDLQASTPKSVEGGEPTSVKKTGALGYGISLPITIPAGRFWPPRDAVDSVEDKKAIFDPDGNPGTVDKTVLPQRPPKDLFSQIRAQARSIQAVDDPERLFGERPSRRRYQTGHANTTSQVNAPPPSSYEDAVVVVAANMRGPI